MPSSSRSRANESACDGFDEIDSREASPYASRDRRHSAAKPTRQDLRKPRKGSRGPRALKLGRSRRFARVAETDELEMLERAESTRPCSAGLGAAVFRTISRMHRV
ncbi:MAG: hypothetical protein SGPRY_008876, partial [Prymnesium sp.]